ncbi:MAG: hypothetical protein HYW24_00220 [Candidatus Aenigmarchaeota archaeon]|nr:hypothetical protein [Candidatus Aenigmarchaeota archaeon]
MSTLTMLKEHLESLSGIETVNFRQENHYPKTDGIWTEFVRIDVVPSGLFKNGVYRENELTELAKKLVPPNLQPNDEIGCRAELGTLIYPKLFFDEEIPGEELDGKYDSSGQYLRRIVVTGYPHMKIAEEASRSIWYKYASRIPEDVLATYDHKRRIYIPSLNLQTQPETKYVARFEILKRIRGLLPAH